MLQVLGLGMLSSGWNMVTGYVALSYVTFPGTTCGGPGGNEFLQFPDHSHSNIPAGSACSLVVCGDCRTDGFIAYTITLNTKAVSISRRRALDL